MKGPSSLVLAAVVALGAGLAHRAQLAADVVRRGADGSYAGRLAVDAPAMDAVSMGQRILASDVLWLRAMLTFVDVLDERDEASSMWLRQMLLAAVQLDPDWRTIPFYGGGMLRVVGDLDGSDMVFGLGEAWHPRDPYFPFSLGMNAYLYRDDAEAAAVHLDRAAKLPSAPPWYRAAAAGFVERKSRDEAAIRYLEEQLEQAQEPEAREILETKLARVRHDALSELMTTALQARAGQTGVPPTDLGLLGALPADPRGGAWTIGPDGVVRSTDAEAELTRKARNAERMALTQPWAGWRPGPALAVPETPGPEGLPGDAQGSTSPRLRPGSQPP